VVQDLLPRPRRLCCRRCFSVCLLATLRKNVRTDLPEIFSEGWQWTSEQMITSSAVVVAKYCDEHVCVYVCVSVCRSVCPGTYLWSNTRDLYQILCMLPMAVAQFSCGRVTKSQREGAILKENLAAHCKVMGHSTVSCAKTAEPIDMPF